MSKSNTTRALGLAVLLLLAIAVQPTEANGWRRFVDSVVPESIREFFGGSPPEPTEAARRMLSEADILKLEEPKEGHLAAGESHLMKMRFPANGEDFPNVHLALTVLDDAGDADIYCVPEFLFDATSQPPTSKFSIWKSEHTQGADHIFISRNHELYEESKVGLREDGETAEAVAFICSVYGFAAGGTDYILAVDVDFTDRSLVTKEQEALEQIFDQCCLGSPAACAPWKSTTNEDSTVSMDFCHIPGNVCNSDGNLIRLDLSGLLMDCKFPTAAIAKMTKLEKLELADNQISGDVSKVMESLRIKTSSLQYIDLKKNALEGSLSKEMMGAIPVCELTHVGSLAFLDLAKNKIKGELPGCLFDASSKLKEISLEGNTVEGSLPSISPDSPLQVLRLQGVGLTGTIPESLGELKDLIVLNLAGNALEGSIPSTLGSAASLVSVKLGDNKLEGAVPMALGQGKHLKYVRLNGNALEQFDDAWFTPGALKSSELVIFDAANNELKGEFPGAFTSAPSLLTLVLEGNSLSGPIPNDPGMFSRAVVLKLSKNKFSGSIPDALGDAGFFSSRARAASPYLAQFDLSKNELTGDIPEFLHAKNIPEGLWERVRLGGNKFDLPCPLPLKYIHVKDLVCANGDSPLDDTPTPVSTAGNLRETQIDPFFGGLAIAVPPETEKSVDGASEDPELADEPAVEPELEDGIEFTQAELSSTGEESRDIALLAQSNEDTIPFAAETAEDAQGVKREDKKSLVKTVKSNAPVVLIGACFLMTIVLAVIIAMVARKKRKQSKADVVSGVINMDLEMQNPPEAEEGDHEHMLSGAKPSAAL